LPEERDRKQAEIDLALAEERAKAIAEEQARIAAKLERLAKIPKIPKPQLTTLDRAMDLLQKFITEERENMINQRQHVPRMDKLPVIVRVWPFEGLHAESGISVGVIITRGTSLQDEMPELVRRFAVQKSVSDVAHLNDIGLNPTPRQKANILRRVARGAPFATACADAFVADKYGAATTHWRKLEDRVHRGVGNPCPLVLIGLPSSIVTFNEPAAVVDALLQEGSEQH
jgi:hypothetical protein